MPQFLRLAQFVRLGGRLSEIRDQKRALAVLYSPKTRTLDPTHRGARHVRAFRFPFHLLPTRSFCPYSGEIWLVLYIPPRIGHSVEMPAWSHPLPSRAFRYIGVICRIHYTWF